MGSSSDDLGDLTARLNLDTSSATAAVKGVADGFPLIGAAAVAVSAAVVGVGAVAVKMAADFQQAMTQLVTGAGESTANLQLVSNGILDMAGQVGESAQALASGMFMIESAGYHGAAGLEVLRAAAEGARVGNADLQTTADAVTTVMRDYKISATNAADATNFLVSVVSQGKTHMQDLAGSLQAILPTASALHVPLQDIGGALATLTARGTPAADAATYLRFTLSALAGEAGPGKKALDEIGLSAQEVGNTLTTKGLLPALQEIEAHLQTKFPQGGATMFAALKEITGGTRGLGAALGLTGQNMDDYIAAVAKVTDQMSSAQGKVLGWNQAQSDFNTKLDEAKAALESIAIRLGQALLPALTSLADWFNSKGLPALQAFATWTGQHVAPALAQLGTFIHDKVLPVVGELATWFEQHIVPVLGDLGKLLTGTVLPALGNLWDVFANKVLPILKDVAGWFTDHVEPVLSDLVKTFIPPLVAILGDAAGGLTFVLTAIYNAAKTFTDWIGAHWKEMMPVFAVVTAALVPMIAQFVAIGVAAAASAATTVTTWVIAKATTIGSFIAITGAAIIQSAATSATWIASAVAAAGAWIAQAARAIFAWATTFVTQMAGAGAAAAATAGTEATATAGAWEAAAAAASGAWVTALEAVSTVATALSAVLVTILGAINNIKQGLKDIFNGQFPRSTVPNPLHIPGVDQLNQGFLNVQPGGAYSGGNWAGGFIPPGMFGAINETGPELLWGGPYGTTVFPRGGEPAGAGGTINLTVNVQGAAPSADEIARAIGWEMAR